MARVALLCCIVVACFMLLYIGRGPTTVEVRSTDLAGARIVTQHGVGMRWHEAIPPPPPSAQHKSNVKRLSSPNFVSFGQREWSPLKPPADLDIWAAHLKRHFKTSSVQPRRTPALAVLSASARL